MEFKTGVLAIKNICSDMSRNGNVCSSCPMRAHCFLDKDSWAWTEQDLEHCKILNAAQKEKKFFNGI